MSDRTGSYVLAPRQKLHPSCLDMLVPGAAIRPHMKPRNIVTLVCQREQFKRIHADYSNIIRRRIFIDFIPARKDSNNFGQSVIFNADSTEIKFRIKFLQIGNIIRYMNFISVHKVSQGEEIFVTIQSAHRINI